MDSEGDRLRALVGRLDGLLPLLALQHRGYQVEMRTALLAVAEAQRQTAEAQQHTDERLNALIAVVDGVVRRLPPQ